MFIFSIGFKQVSLCVFIVKCVVQKTNYSFSNVHCCTVHSDIYTVHSQRNALLLNLEEFKIYIKNPHKNRSYVFRSTTIFRELVLSLAKVILKHSV
jgi:hypothetical protein